MDALLAHKCIQDLHFKPKELRELMSDTRMKALYIGSILAEYENREKNK